MNRRPTHVIFLAIISLAATLQAQSSRVPLGLDHEGLHVHDLARSADFYEHVIGLTRMPDPFKTGRIVWFRVGEHGQLHLIGGAAGNSCQDKGVHLALRVGSVEDFASHLDEMHVKYEDTDGIAHSIKARPDAVKQIYLQDPEGYWIEINDNKF